MRSRAKTGSRIPGAVGAVPEIDDFVAACVDAHGVAPEPRVRQGIYALDAVVPPAAPRAAAACGDVGRSASARPLVGRIRPSKPSARSSRTTRQNAAVSTTG